MSHKDAQNTDVNETIGVNTAGFVPTTARDSNDSMVTGDAANDAGPDLKALVLPPFPVPWPPNVLVLPLCSGALKTLASMHVHAHVSRMKLAKSNESQKRPVPAPTPLRCDGDLWWALDPVPQSADKVVQRIEFGARCSGCIVVRVAMSAPDAAAAPCALSKVTKPTNAQDGQNMNHKTTADVVAGCPEPHALTELFVQLHNTNVTHTIHRIEHRSPADTQEHSDETSVKPQERTFVASEAAVCNDVEGNSRPVGKVDGCTWYRYWAELRSISADNGSAEFAVQ